MIQWDEDRAPATRANKPRRCAEGVHQQRGSKRDWIDEDGCRAEVRDIANEEGGDKDFVKSTSELLAYKVQT